MRWDRQSVFQRAWNLSGNVLDESAPERHVQDLQTSADCENRKVLGPGLTNERDFKFVA